MASDDHLRSRAFTIRDTKNVFSEEQGENRFTGLATDVATMVKATLSSKMEQGASSARRGDLRINVKISCRMA